MKLPGPAPSLTEIKSPLIAEKKLTVSVLRLDEIHPYMSGNKWFKLFYNVEEFFRQQKKILVTAGGAFSNHIIATAAAGKELGIPTVGIIRGDELHADANAALRFASGCGMKLFFISREAYRNIREISSLPAEILSRTGYPSDDIYFLPEGGSNPLAIQGCMEIPEFISVDFDVICCACGTGATLAGISAALHQEKAIGISVLNGNHFLEKDILKMNGGRKNFSLFHEYTFGGYAKQNDKLDEFCNDFTDTFHFRIEPVYTGRMFYGLFDLIQRNYFLKGSKIIAIHTGGVANSGV